MLLKKGFFYQSLCIWLLFYLENFLCSLTELGLPLVLHTTVRKTERCKTKILLDGFLCICVLLKFILEF